MYRPVPNYPYTQQLIPWADLVYLMTYLHDTIFLSIVILAYIIMCTQHNGRKLEWFSWISVRRSTEFGTRVFFGSRNI